MVAGLPPRDGARRRDRRGRGLRGPILPPDLPWAGGKAARFDRIVEGCLARLERSWSAQLRRIEVTVEEVPNVDPASWEDGMVPLAHTFGRHGGQPTRITLYRRPIESRADGLAELAILVLDVLVEQLAHLLGRSPRDIDPGYDR